MHKEEQEYEKIEIINNDCLKGKFYTIHVVYGDEWKVRLFMTLILQKFFACLAKYVRMSSKYQLGNNFSILVTTPKVTNSLQCKIKFQNNM